MNDRLPIISIKVKKTQEFIDRLEEIASKNGFVHVEKKSDTNKNTILTIEHDSQNKHEGLCGQLISQSNKIVKIEVRASRWNPTPVTYEVFTQEALSLFEPLVEKYNKLYKSEYKIEVQSKEELEPKLTSEVQTAFDYFLNSANVGSLHPRDWERFYYFVYECRAKKSKLSEDDILYLLYSKGFSEDMARYMANIYRHIIDFMKCCSR